MQGWITGFQESINFIEQNLTEELNNEEIASMAALSPFYYQRIFGALCGMTVGEYFHGITPSQAREPGAPLRSLAPLHIKITLEGGSMLDYRIVEKAPFTIVGVKRRFNSDTSYQEIPKFWNEWMSDMKGLKGTFGVCLDMDGKDFDYWIADLYMPWEDIQKGCGTYVIPGGLWAQFICKGPLPDSLQSVNTKIWSEWLPSLKGYSLAGNYSLEVYAPPAEKPEDTLSYIWIPLKKDEG